MSNFILYHGLGIRGYEHVRADDVGGRLVFTIRQSRENLRCSGCDSANLFLKGQVEREWRAPPLGGKPVSVRFAVPRVQCRDCGLIRQVRVQFADEKVRYTRSFGRYALELSRHTTIQAAAEHLGIGWDLMKDIQKEYLQRHYSKPKLKHLQRIAIDEISIGKGHKYLTIVLDLQSGAVVFQGEGKGSETLIPFWKRLRCSGAKIKAVAIDMSPAYWLAVRENLPEAAVIFDHFHIVKLFNHELSELRRELYHECTKLQQRVLKGIRWLLLMNPENLDPKKNEPQRLQEALKLNESLAKAYYLKEQLRQIWDEPDKRCAAAAALDCWVLMAEYSGVRRLQKLAKTIQIHRRGILAWYDHPITTASLEGTNNKIKTMKRQAYGFRDIQFLKLKIFAIHEAQYALVG